MERVPLSVAWKSPMLTKAWQGAVQREARRRKSQRVRCWPGALLQRTACAQGRGTMGRAGGGGAGRQRSPKGSATLLPSVAS